VRGDKKKKRKRVQFVDVLLPKSAVLLLAEEFEERG
jgi:hypothetical protein